MNKADYEAFRRKAMRYAYLKGFGHLAEDFAQEYIIHVLEKRSQFIDTFFIDWLRMEFKGSRNPQNRNRTFYCYDELETYEEDNKVSQEILSRYTEQCQQYNSDYIEQSRVPQYGPFVKEVLRHFEEGLTIKQVMRKFQLKRTIANQIFVIYLMERNYTQREIAKVMVLTESRVSQILTQFKNSQAS